MIEIPDVLKKELEKKGGWNDIKKKLSFEDIKVVERVVKALSYEVRLKILYGLYQQRMCVCMLTDLTDCSYSKCSYHISKLKDAGLIKGEKNGIHIIYSLTPFGKSIVRHFNKYKPEEVKK